MNRSGSGIADPDAPVRGEEVYASHDCTDCHLGAPVLRQKRDKKEVGLIRVRTDFAVLQKFLETDQRHQSFVMISEKDRRDLIAYLRTLIGK
jgi:cytochrome c2